MALSDHSCFILNFLLKREEKLLEPKSQASHILVPQLAAIFFSLSHVRCCEFNTCFLHWTSTQQWPAEVEASHCCVTLRKTHQDRLGPTKTCGTAQWVQHERFTCDNNQYDI